ncbi:MAG: hypothetical protein NTX12_02630 [Actinobacteria bacterium]|nr:hypothetical protein [Actinomycetota bacterium]
MRKNYLALAIVVAVAMNIPVATASTSPSQAVTSIQKVLTTKSAELKAWLAKELAEEGVLGAKYVPLINAANQKLDATLKDLANTYNPLLGSADTTISYPAQSNYAKAQAVAHEENQKVVDDIKATWNVDLKAIDEVYEPAEKVMLDQIAVAKNALLAAKRAAKEASSFDVAFAAALNFEMNRVALSKVAKSEWSGKIKLAALNSLAKVEAVSKKADALASSYSYGGAVKFNSLVGTAVVSDSAFKSQLAKAKKLFS